MPRDLNGMGVAITGASAGIGRALALALARRGARLVLAARSGDALANLVAEAGGGHCACVCDVASSDDCARFIATAQAHLGRIDTLVCNAGIGLFRRIEDTTDDEWQRMFATNLLGTTACLRAAVPVMRRQEARAGWRGQVMITSSVLALRGIPDYGAYCATKSAQLMVAQAARVELAAERIAVTTVHPARTLTGFNAAAERLSGRRKAAPSHFEPGHTPEAVATDMLRAIERPRAEVWPRRGSRTLFHLLAWWPRLADTILARHKRVE